MLSVIYKNKDFLVLNKPAGILTHGIKNQKLGIRENELTVADWLLKHFPEVKNVGDEPSMRPGIVHRLDKDTSGVLLIARNQKFFEYAKKLFQERQIQKTYFALVCGKLIGQGIIDKPIGLKSGSLKRSVRGKSLKMIKDAVTEYASLKIFEYEGKFYSLLRLAPKTGRTHQLRIHLASIGHSIVGDELYNKQENPWHLKRQFLHAESIEFSLADGERLKIEAEMPDDLQKILISLTDGRRTYMS